MLLTYYYQGKNVGLICFIVTPRKKPFLIFMLATSKRRTVTVLFYFFLLQESWINSAICHAIRSL